MQSRYTVLIEWYSLAPNQVGLLTGERETFHHRTLKAARRRLGSIISGKQARLRYRTPTPDGGAGCRLLIVTPEGEHLSANAAMQRIKQEDSNATPSF